MIRFSMNIRENCPRKCFRTKEKETWVKFNPGLSANQPSNNWALKGTINNNNYQENILMIKSHTNLDRSSVLSLQLHVYEGKIQL